MCEVPMFIILFLIIFSISSAQEILILNYGRDGVKRYDEIISGIKDNAQMDQTLYVEYLDLLQRNRYDHLENLKKLYYSKYEDKNFDYIIVIGKDIPITFESQLLSKEFFYVESLFSKDTIDIDKVNIEKYLKTIIAIHPRLTDIYFYSIPEANIRSLQGKYPNLNFYEINKKNLTYISKIRSRNNTNILITGRDIPEDLRVNIPIYSYKTKAKPKYTISLVRDYYTTGRSIIKSISNGFNDQKLKDYFYLVNKGKEIKYKLFLRPLKGNYSYFKTNENKIDRLMVIYLLLVIFISTTLILIFMGFYGNKLLIKHKKLKSIAEENSRIKDEFLANMTHELRTPLNGIIGMTELMKENSPSKRVAILDQSAKHLLSVVNDILDFSKLKAKQDEIHLSLVDTKDLVNEVINLFPQKDNVKIKCFVDVSTPRKIYVDYLKIKKILINLMGNAIKYTDRGEVILKIEVLTSSISEVSLKFSVIDTGIGIPENKLTDIFKDFHQIERFHSRNHGGTGLGLTIVKKLLNLMDSTVTIKSIVGKGSIFSFQLNLKIADTNFKGYNKTIILVGNSSKCLSPHLSRMEVDFILADKEDVMDLLEVVESPIVYSSEELDINYTRVVDTLKDGYKLGDRDFISLNPFIDINLLKTSNFIHKRNSTTKYSGRILIVEDNPINIRVLREFLRDRVDYYIANSGLEVLDLDLEYFDLILMDIELPDTDGITLTRELNTPLPIVAISAHSSKDFKDRAKDSGMSHFLSKPLNFKKLEVILEKYLKSEISLLLTDYTEEFLIELIDSFIIEYETSLPLLKSGDPKELHKLQGSLEYFKEEKLLLLFKELKKDSNNLNEFLIELSNFVYRLKLYRGNKDEYPSS